MDSYISNYQSLQNQVRAFQSSEGQTVGGWSHQQQRHDYRTRNLGYSETLRSAYPETASSNERSPIVHGLYQAYNYYTRPPYSYQTPGSAGPRQLYNLDTNCGQNADSQMVTGFSPMNTSVSYGSPDRRFDREIQNQESPVAYLHPFLDNAGPTMHERCVKIVQEMPASSYQETAGRPSAESSRNLETGNWVDSVQASPVTFPHVLPTMTTEECQCELLSLECPTSSQSSQEVSRAYDNKTKATLGDVDGSAIAQACRKSGNQHPSLILDGEQYNNVSVFSQDQTETESIQELARALEGINDIDPSTVDIDRMIQAGEHNDHPRNQAAALLLQNDGATNSMQPMMRAAHSEHSTSQPCQRRGCHINRLMPDHELFRKNMKDEKFSPALKVYASKAKSRRNFAAILNRHVFSREERKTSNVSGSKKKKKLNPYWIDTIRKTVFQYWPLVSNNPKEPNNEEDAWKDCITGIDMANRQPK